MPFQPIIPTWLALNNCNFATPSGITDPRTTQDFPVGGLGLGDYFDVTEKEANAASALSVGLLHWGRYRLVQVDSGATAANVKTGMVGNAMWGQSVQSVSIADPGTGGTPGVYTIQVPPGQVVGGNGAVIQVVVGSSGTITFVGVLSGGYGYLNSPVFPLTATGVTGGELVVGMGFTSNVVTSADVASNPPTSENSVGPNFGLRPVVFLNSITPGNFGFVQELGLATALIEPAQTGGPGWFVTTVGHTGRVALNGTFNPFGLLGVFVDYLNNANTVPVLGKVLLQYVPVCQD